MNQLPYRPPQGNVFNYGQAVSEGQTIADNALTIREKSRQAQGQAASNALAQQGISGQQKYDMLSQQGFGDMAKVEAELKQKQLYTVKQDLFIDILKKSLQALPGIMNHQTRFNVSEQQLLKVQ